MATLARQQHPLADSASQLRHYDEVTGIIPPFSSTLQKAGYDGLFAGRPEILQINVGKLCNQTCRHCHVDAGPDRREVMSRETMEQCLQFLDRSGMKTVDITGGAPELNPHYRWLVSECRQRGCRVMTRCNLTIITAHERFNDLPRFFAQHQVEVISSLPFYEASRTDRQRGTGVFDASIEALLLLNAEGYGKPDSGLQLHLVYNPVGAFLSAPQQMLEQQFKKELSNRYGIVFNNLYVINNLPISRFLHFLLQSGQYEEYMKKLVMAFNPATVPALMCRYTLSVSWEGFLYDCDFNQMLDLKITDQAGNARHISTVPAEALQERRIMVSQHCYGCTAGSGSSCGGQLVP
ncbi:MAG: arsenosugar biosynthesis radical SAM protein ArsS [Chitinophagales bacterium]|nr:arsenosugar biosynthesis radical SAM protein ArsS [Chitinophagales bacterium]MDW8394365.1 arsenosugar biosynthesis radical SAM protein ArsS [Chitinophagales bacterium]